MQLSEEISGTGTTSREPNNLRIMKALENLSDAIQGIKRLECQFRGTKTDGPQREPSANKEQVMSIGELINSLPDILCQMEDRIRTHIKEIREIIL